MSIYNNNGRWGRKSQQFHKAHSTDQRTGTTHFEYDKLGRITQAGNELIEQREFGNEASLTAKLMAQLGGQPIAKKDAAPLSDGLDGQTPLRITEFKRDVLGRLIHTLARNNDKVQETVWDLCKIPQNPLNSHSDI